MSPALISRPASSSRARTRTSLNDAARLEVSSSRERQLLVPVPMLSKAPRPLRSPARQGPAVPSDQRLYTQAGTERCQHAPDLSAAKVAGDAAPISQRTRHGVHPRSARFLQGCPHLQRLVGDVPKPVDHDKRHACLRHLARRGVLVRALASAGAAPHPARAAPARATERTQRASTAAPSASLSSRRRAAAGRSCACVHCARLRDPAPAYITGHTAAPASFPVVRPPPVAPQDGQGERCAGSARHGARRVRPACRCGGPLPPPIGAIASWTTAVNIIIVIIMKPPTFITMQIRWRRIPGADVPIGSRQPPGTTGQPGQAPTNVYTHASLHRRPGRQPRMSRVGTCAGASPGAQTTNGPPVHREGEVACAALLPHLACSEAAVKRGASATHHRSDMAAPTVYRAVGSLSSMLLTRRSGRARAISRLADGPATRPASPLASAARPRGRRSWLLRGAQRSGRLVLLASAGAPSGEETLILYSKDGCCLCDGLKEKLAEFVGEPGGLPNLKLEVRARRVAAHLLRCASVRDITTNDDWFQRFQYEIPVLALLPLQEGQPEVRAPKHCPSRSSSERSCLHLYAPLLGERRRPALGGVLAGDSLTTMLRCVVPVQTIIPRSSPRASAGRIQQSIEAALQKRAQ
eukprot:scaffold184_cov379-Prasinococcus_capsulatus_cf.AAC.16